MTDEQKLAFLDWLFAEDTYAYPNFKKAHSAWLESSTPETFREFCERCFSRGYIDE